MNYREVQLSEPVRSRFESLGFKIYCEVRFYGRNVDMVGIRGNEIIAIELKCKLNDKVIEQARSNQLFANKSYIAVDKTALDKIETCKRFNLGLLLGALELFPPETNIPVPIGNYRDGILKSCELSKYYGRDVAGLPNQKDIGHAVSVNDAVIDYKKNHPSADWKELYANIPNHYASAKSMKQSIEKFRQFKEIKEKHSGRTCGECYRRERGFCGKGYKRRPTSKACINFTERKFKSFE